MTLSTTLNRYYMLTKPGIIRGNLIIMIAGYLFGAAGNPNWGTLLGVVLGGSLIIASACVYNNILDRNIDKQMDRTKNRALVEKTISVRNAVIFGTVLLGLAVLIFLLSTNTLALAVALIGHAAYVILYTFGKRVTVHGTLLGTVSGATPPVIGYVAATGVLDLTALLLFLLLVAWQMPHFYSIAIFRYDDYARAKIPVLPVVKGLVATRFQMTVYIAAFVLASVALSILGSLSLLSMLILVLAGSYWLYLATLPAGNLGETVAWARQQFGTSLYVLLIFSGVLAIDSLLAV